MRCPDAFVSFMLPWIFMNHIFSEVFELFEASDFKYDDPFPFFYIQTLYC